MVLSHEIIFKLINYIFIVTAFLMIFWLLNVFVRNHAIDGCAKNAQYTQQLPNESASATYPITDLYNKCLEDKGIK